MKIRHSNLKLRFVFFCFHFYKKTNTNAGGFKAGQELSNRILFYATMVAGSLFEIVCLLRLCNLFTPFVRTTYSQHHSEFFVKYRRVATELWRKSCWNLNWDIFTKKNVTNECTSSSSSSSPSYKNSLYNNPDYKTI